MAGCGSAHSGCSTAAARPRVTRTGCSWRSSAWHWQGLGVHWAAGLRAVGLESGHTCRGRTNATSTDMDRHIGTRAPRATGPTSAAIAAGRIGATLSSSRWSIATAYSFEFEESVSYVSAVTGAWRRGFDAAEPQPPAAGPTKVFDARVLSKFPLKGPQK